ncbi:hypothetical protein WA026_012860 [Henosepilachna vigintioctopunctata]|uniref:Uncharacterized protein n=1 Tax=Henosepilachna vigintioctopunctata TaxID=420089 RepID=A0AAW1TTR6_9CUCU
MMYGRAVFTIENNHWNLYKKKRNNVICRLRDEEKTFYHQLIQESSSQDVWRNIKHLLIKSRNNKGGVAFNGKIIEDETSIAEHFNSFFLNGFIEKHNLLLSN